MKIRIFAALLAAGLALSACAGAGEASRDVNFKTTNDSLSYAVGTDIGNSLNRGDLDLNGDFLYAGIMDVISDEREKKLTDDEIRGLLERWQDEMLKRIEARNEVDLSENLEKGQKFLEENKTKEGVVELPSGLQYKVLEEGTGETPDSGDKVLVHYTGKLIDGKVFDSSYSRGEPTLFPVNGVIPGWTEALQLMKEGSKWMLYIPPSLAYGKRSAGPDIGPNSTLIFEVELLDIK